MVKRLHQRILFLREQSGRSRAGKIAHLACSGSQLEHRIRFILPACGASHTRGSTHYGHSQENSISPSILSTYTILLCIMCAQYSTDNRTVACLDRTKEVINLFYYMASSVSGEDEPNPAL